LEDLYEGVKEVSYYMDIERKQLTENKQKCYV